MELIPNKPLTDDDIHIVAVYHEGRGEWLQAMAAWYIRCLYFPKGLICAFDSGEVKYLFSPDSISSWDDFLTPEGMYFN